MSGEMGRVELERLIAGQPEPSAMVRGQGLLVGAFLRN
jgi:hypothetical protein